MTEQQRGKVAGALFGKREPRIVRIDQVPIEAVPEGHMLVFSNQDTPGVIGRIGTILGKAAVCVVNVDSMIADDLMQAIRGLPNLIYAKVVTL